MKHGFMYLTAIIDWHSRYIISWSISNTLEMSNCIDTLSVFGLQNTCRSISQQGFKSMLKYVENTIPDSLNISHYNANSYSISAEVVNKKKKSSKRKKYNNK